MVGFQTVKLYSVNNDIHGNPLPLTVLKDTKYWLVIAESGTPSFEWYTSQKSNPYIYGDASGAVDKDYYFKIYYDINSSPIEQNVDIDLSTGVQRSCVMNNNYLTTDAKVALALVIDDSSSMKTEYRFLDIQDNINNLDAKIARVQSLITTLFDRTKDVRGNDKSYTDIWVYGSQIDNLTNGYINSRELISNALQLMYNKGNVSDLYGAVGRAIIGLNQQSLIDVNTSMELSAAEVWAKGFIPVIIVISDGDYTPGSAEDVALTANTIWDDNGVSIFCFGMGYSHDQTGLRTMANLSGGKHFSITDQQ